MMTDEGRAEGGTQADGAQRRRLTFTSMSATCMSQALSENTWARASMYQEPRLVFRMAAVPATRTEAPTV